jgi:hypothetical protein
LKILQAVRNKLKKAFFDVYGIHPIQEILCLNISTEEENIFREEVKGLLYELCTVHC